MSRIVLRSINTAPTTATEHALHMQATGPGGSIIRGRWRLASELSIPPQPDNRDTLADHLLPSRRSPHWRILVTCVSVLALVAMVCVCVAPARRGLRPSATPRYTCG